MVREKSKKPGGPVLPRLAASATLVAAALIVVPSASADCTPNLRRAFRPSTVDVIELRADHGVAESLLAKAIAVWEQCPDYGRGFPTFVTRRPSAPARVLTVEYRWRSRSPICGRLLGSEIQIYAFAVDALGAEQRCGSPVLILAHELGHVLGLADGSQEPGCRNQIMAYIDGGNRYRRKVHQAECSAASQRWLPAGEPRPASTSTR